MKLMIDRPTTQLFYDAAEKTVMGKMSGDILFEDYKQMLLAGAQLAKAGKADKIILDRRYITKQDVECRLWVKDYYIKEHVKPLVPFIKKVAVIDAKSVVGRWYGATILSTLSLFYPNMRMKSFGELEKGIAWTMESESKQITVEEVIADENSFFEDITSIEQESQNEPLAIEEPPVSSLQHSPTRREASFMNKLYRYFFPESLV